MAEGVEEGASTGLVDTFDEVPERPGRAADRPAYVILTFDAFREMEADAMLQRVSASESDIAAGRVRRGSADDLMAELAEE